MSRCFPFPPPGYEKTPRLEESSVLKEEKKEKKHKKEKKEKKDREKREGKDKKEKRDKKEKHKKEKHRDTKEEKKEKGILGIKIDDKLGSSTKEEGKNVTFGSNAKNGSSVYLHKNGEHNIPIPIPIPSSNNYNINLISRGARDSNLVVELAKRINDEEKVIHGHDRMDKNGDSRFVEELARRFKDEEKVTTNQLDEGNFVVDKKGKEKDTMINNKSREKSMVQIVTGTGISSIGEKLVPITKENDVKKGTQEKEKPKENSDKSRKKHKSKDGEKKSHKKDKDTEKEKKKKKKDKKKITEPVTRCDEIKPNGPVNLSNELMGIVEATEKLRKEMETNGPVNSSNGFKVMGSVPLSDPRSNEKRRKEMGTNGAPTYSSNASSSTTYTADATQLGSVPFSGQKNHTEVRNENKLKQIEMNGPDNVNSNTTTKNHTVTVTQVVGPVPLSDHRNITLVEGNAKKRKDIDVNGLIYDNEAKLNKVPRLSSDDSLENGRKPEAHRSVKMVASEKHGGSAKNGIMDAKSVQILGPNHPSVLNDHQIVEKSRKLKPPHPDTEFLNQILAVPKMDEWSGFDDQEWLVRGQDPRKPEVVGLASEEEMQVWSEALNIESMDIVALPYVLPY